MILHIEKENKNYVLKYKNLETLVAGISGTYFLDRDEEVEINKEDRLVLVTVINENFEIIDDLEKAITFNDYSTILNDFLEEKIKIKKISINFLDDSNFDFKYCCVNFRLKDSKLNTHKNPFYNR